MQDVLEDGEGDVEQLCELAERRIDALFELAETRLQRLVHGGAPCRQRRRLHLLLCGLLHSGVCVSVVGAAVTLGMFASMVAVLIVFWLC